MADLARVTYPPPGVNKLNVTQREGFLSILADIEATGFKREALDEKTSALVERMASISSTGDDRQKLIDQLGDWVRWYPLGGYYLAYLFQALMNARGDLGFIPACLLFADAQNHFAEDLSLNSLEKAYVALDGYIKQFGENPAGGQLLSSLNSAIRFRIRISYDYYRRLYSNDQYRNINPLAECLYFQKAWMDLREAFPELPWSVRQAGLELLQSVIDRCAKPEDTYCRVVALRMLGLNRGASSDFVAAEDAYRKALIEARQVQLRSEVGHLHRLRGFALMRLGRLDEAEKEQDSALAYEAYPKYSWWQAVTLGEIGDIRLRRIVGPFDPQNPPPQAIAAANAYARCRDTFERHVAACVLPVDRAVKQQLMRSYADNAVQVEALHGFEGVASVETFGPRYANDLVVEGRVAATLDPTGYAQFRAARSIVHEDLGTFSTGVDLETALDEYLKHVIEHRPARRSYFQFRNTHVPEIAEPQLGQTVIKRTRALRLPDTILLLVNVERTHLRVVIIDASTGVPVLMTLADLKDGEWSQVHGAYDSAAARAVRIAMQHGDPVPVMKPALDALLDSYEALLGGLLTPLLPAIERKQLKVFPRFEMNRVPLHAVQLGGRRLIDVCDVSYAPSLSLFLELRQGTTYPGTGSLTVVRDVNRTKSYGGTLDALKALTAQTPGALFSVSDPTWQNFRDSLTRHAPSDILFACHGVFDVDDPKNSRLQFRLSEQVTFSAIFADLDLRGCRSVFMGACESGIGRTLVAAEYVGLPMAFLAAGVRYVIGTMWQVTQLSAAIMVANHFELLLKENRTVVGSLNEAARRLKSMSQSDVMAWVKQHAPDLSHEVEASLVQLGDPPFAHPYYWAGFYVSGDA